jgi:peptidoglycan/xylan/chitin deacetylase (PgdA/CDA1 family)
VNTVLKHLAESVLIRSGFARVVRRTRRGRMLVLAYHNVLPDDESPSGDMNLHLPQREFASQLDVIARTHDVVSIESLGQPAPSSSRPRVVITFDDAYMGAVTVGVRELVKRGMPATIFVAPGIIDSVTWWDSLAQHTGGVIDGDLRQHVLETLGGNAQSVFDWMNSKFEASSSRTTLPRICTMTQLTEAASQPRITIGSHTWSHLNLCSLTAADLAGELTSSDQWLRSRFSSVVPWLSYPYGLHNDTVVRATAEARYAGAFRIDGGWLERSLSLPSYTLPRLNIPSGLSLNGFRLRLAGF